MLSMFGGSSGVDYEELLRLQQEIDKHPVLKEVRAGEREVAFLKRYFPGKVSDAPYPPLFAIPLIEDADVASGYAEMVFSDKTTKRVKLF